MGLGTDLFVRSSREVRLTEASRPFLDGARRTLAEATAPSRRRSGRRAGELGQLRVPSAGARFETLPALGHALPLDWTIPAPSK